MDQFKRSYFWLMAIPEESRENKDEALLKKKNSITEIILQFERAHLVPSIIKENKQEAKMDKPPQNTS